MLATNMNMMGSSMDLNTTGSTTSGTTAIDLLGSGTTNTGDLSGMSTVFKTFGLDMAQIMTKRYLYENGQSGPTTKRWTDPAIFDSANNDNGTGVAVGDATKSTNATSNTTTTPTTSTTGASSTNGDSSDLYWQMSWFDKFKASAGGTIYDGHLFIGFRIERGSGASETFSNSTGETQISQVANQKFQEGLDARYSTMGGKAIGGALGDTLGAVIGVASGILSGIGNSIGVDPLAAVMTGAARIDIPEVWMSSSYSRSASFTLSCLSPYGDMESIFQSEYVPLACLLAGVLPRATGYSSHSAPFVCQAYCRGIFSSPLCVIESLDITRGADQFGFTANRLPLELTIHLTLKDLYPVMAMSMGGDKGIAEQLLGNDDLFNEYMLTLAGMGLRDRLAPFRNIRRKAQILLSTARKNIASPFMMGMEAGSRFKISRLISTIVSGGRGLQGT